MLLENTQASGLPIFSSEISLLSSSESQAKKQAKGPSSVDINTLGMYGWLLNAWASKSMTKIGIQGRSSDSSSDSSSERGGAFKSDSSYENNVLNTLLSLRKDPSTRMTIFTFLKTGLAVVAKGEKSREAGFFETAAVTPIFLKTLAGEKTSLEISRELRVGKHSVGLGTTAIKLTTYKGEQPFVIKTPQGEPITQINPGDQLGHLHVSHQAALMRGLSPLEKAEQITQDFIGLFKIIDKGDNLNLSDKQCEVLTKAQNSTLIGISHLVRLFRRKTGLPTWQLNILPKLVQKFHQHDSQAVSKAFGGTRKVQLTDVEMMVITPAIRQKLVALNL